MYHLKQCKSLTCSLEAPTFIRKAFQVYHLKLSQAPKHYKYHSIHPITPSTKLEASITLTRKMASTQLLILISSLMLFQLAFSDPVKKIDVVVEGMVYCQSCEHAGSWSLSGAKPIPAAKVSVICKNYKDQVSYYKVFETDGNGYFYAQLEGFTMSQCLVEHPLQSCHVKPVSSPLENCNLLTNVNYGLYGSPLRYESKKLLGSNYEAVIYAAGPLAFRPDHCPPPTHV
jgi:hypothetical protein